MKWKPRNEKKRLELNSQNMDEGTYVSACHDLTFDAPSEVNAQSGHQSPMKDQWGDSLFLLDESGHAPFKTDN